MPKEYVPKDVKATGSTDQNGNEGYSVLFSDGSNAFLLAKKAPVVGQPEWGEIYDAPKKNKPNETYKRFKRMQREEFGVQSTAPVATGGVEERVAKLEERVAKLEAGTTQSTSEPFPEAPAESQSLTNKPELDDYIDLNDIPF